MKRHQTVTAMLLSSTLLGSMALVGCSSTPKPDAELAVSQKSVETAVTAGASEYAPVELKTAQDKLKEAEAAMKEEEYVKARRLAEEVTVDAKLAESISFASKAQAALTDAQKSQQALQQEIGRQAP